MIRFLQSPGKVKKYLLGGLLVFISITMLLYLIPQGGSNITGQPNILARVVDDNITIEDVEIVGAKQIFSASGMPEKPITNVRWVNVTAQGEAAGLIEHARDWTMKNVKLQTPAGEAVRLSDCKNVEPPEVVKLKTAAGGQKD